MLLKAMTSFRNSQFIIHHSSFFPSPQLHRGLIAFSLEPVLVEIHRKHEQQDENGDPLRDVGELASVDGHVGDMTSLEDSGQSYYVWQMLGSVFIARMDPANPTRLTSDRSVGSQSTPMVTDAGSSTSMR